MRLIPDAKAYHLSEPGVIIEMPATPIPSTKSQILIATICTSLKAAARTFVVFTSHESRVTNHDLSNRPIQELEASLTPLKQRTAPNSNRPKFRNCPAGIPSIRTSPPSRHGFECMDNRTQRW